MLSFARALGEALMRDGHRVILTRNDDVFVSLRERVSIAHKMQADVLISLHADALSGGGARGATVYTLTNEATDAASSQLARGHDRSDILGGVDLVGQDDTVAGVLIDLARRETQPRADRLAELLVGGIKASVDGINSRPRRQAGFAVLKAPDIPSVLVELGFMSDAQDLANLTKPEWRAQAILGLVAGVRLWAAEDVELAKRTRQ
jgi:N-acetylmuramoyl-L-alanine amidase